MLILFKSPIKRKLEQLFPTGDKELNILEMENELAPFKVGDLVGQIWFEEIINPEWEEVDELSDT